MFTNSYTNLAKKTKLMRFMSKYQRLKRLIKTLMNLLSISLHLHLTKLISMLKILRNNKQLRLMRQSLTQHYAISTMEKTKKQLINYPMPLNSLQKRMNNQILNSKPSIFTYFTNAYLIKSLKLSIIKIKNMRLIHMRSYLFIITLWVLNLSSKLLIMSWRN